MSRNRRFSWSWVLPSTPERLWPLVSDTNRFNADIGLPVLDESKIEEGGTVRRQLALNTYGFSLTWEEEPFEWIQNESFGFVRRYRSGPLQSITTQVSLHPENDGTRLDFEMTVAARNALWALLVPPFMALVGKQRIERAFSRYGSLAKMGEAATPLYKPTVRFMPGGRERLQDFRQALLDERANPALVASLLDVIETADDLSVSRLRPYALADAWKQNRKEVLTLCLQATRAGLLEFRWEFLCPLCRGPQQSVATLADAQNTMHCGSCNIDFSVNFDRSVELVFRPNGAIREYSDQSYCVGGPQVTPHIISQQRIKAGETRSVHVAMEAGRYRLRCLGKEGAQLLLAKEQSTTKTEVTVDQWNQEEITLSTKAELRLTNKASQEQIVVLERLAWTDQAATAAEVTALQMFRDLFSTEALRAGEHISVGQLTVVFTDLKGSTKMYQEIGDAPAFGLVLDHFDVIKSAIADYDGAIVKNIGDAIMAVFRRPANAVQAMLRAQAALANPPQGQKALTLRSGMHQGVCIAVNLNGRLDYFGTAVNKAARLEGKSLGNDVVVSAETFADPEIQTLVAANGGYRATPFEDELKGFEGKVTLYRIAKK